MDSPDIFDGLSLAIESVWDIGERYGAAIIDKAIKHGFREARLQRPQHSHLPTSSSALPFRQRRRSRRTHAGMRTMSAYDPGRHHGASQIERHHVWQFREPGIGELDGSIATAAGTSAPSLPHGTQSTYTRFLTNPTAEQHADMESFNIRAFIDSTLYTPTRLVAHALSSDNEDTGNDDAGDDDAGDDDDADDDNTDDEDSACCICFAKIPRIILNPCAHEFCMSCVRKIRRHNKPCPVCRSGISHIIEDLTL